MNHAQLSHVRWTGFVERETLHSRTRIRGTLIRVSPDKQEVAVDIRDRGRLATMTLHVDGETQIMLGRKAGKLADLTLGKRVRVLYEVQNGQPIVRSIIAPGVITLNPALLETLSGIGAANGINLGGLLNPPKNAPPAMLATNVPNGIGGILRRVSRTDRELVILGDPAPGKPPAETTSSDGRALPVIKANGGWMTSRRSSCRRLSPKSRLAQSVRLANPSWRVRRPGGGSKCSRTAIARIPLLRLLDGILKTMHRGGYSGQDWV